MSLIQGRTGDWEIVIGLEVHAQVVSEAKLEHIFGSIADLRRNSERSPLTGRRDTAEE